MLEADISVGDLADRDGWFSAGPLVAERLVKETLRAEPGPTVGAALGRYFALNFCSG
jgi:hypothetical protein